jgi:predicted amidohydrolase
MTGQELEVYRTGIGSLAFPICMDATFFETFCIAEDKGAEIVMIPIANPDPDYNYWTAMRGIWSRIQESNLYGVKSAMVRSFLGFKLTGQAGFYAPLELTENKDGVIAEAVSFDQEEIVLAELDLQRLGEYRASLEEERNLFLRRGIFRVSI